MLRSPDSVEPNERAFFAPVADTDTLQPIPTTPAVAQEAFRRRHLSASVGLAPIGRAIARAVVLEWERGALFLAVPPIMIAGVFAYLALPIEPSPVAVAACVLLLAIAAYAARQRFMLNLALLGALVFVLGLACAQLETWRAGTKVLGSEITTRLSGRVVDIDHLANGRTRLTIDVLDTERPKLRYAPQRVRVSAASVPYDLVSGSVVEGVAKLFPPSGPLRPGSYDFAYESYFNRIGANGFFFREPTIARMAEPAPVRQRLWAAVDNFRNRVADHIRNAIGGPEGEIAAALVVGIRAGIPEDVNEDMRRTGLAHVLSISGLHMALVASSIMIGMRCVFALFPGFASRHAVKKFAAVIALVGVATYLVVSGAEVAAVRSFIMLAVMLIAVMFDRAALTMRNLAIAAILVVLVAPHEVVGPSFQMSFAATAALIGGYAGWSTWRERKGSAPLHAGVAKFAASKIWRWLVGIALTAIIAGVATSIYGAWHFQRISPLSLAANLATTPITIVVMGSSVAAVTLMPFGLDGPFWALNGVLLGWMLEIARWLSERSPVDAVGMIPQGAVLLLTIALLVAVLTTTWLRVLALPVMLAGLVLLSHRTFPDVFVGEDGRLVGVRTMSGDLAVNRPRPNVFTVEDWQRTIAAPTALRPSMGRPAEDEVSQFTCEQGACTIVRGDGSLIVHVADGAQASVFCDTAVLIVVEKPVTALDCGNGGAVIVTARDLAANGSATVRFSKGAQATEVAIEYAIKRPYRPWHDHRRFSRAARGLEPYQRKSAGGNEG